MRQTGACQGSKASSKILEFGALIQHSPKLQLQQLSWHTARGGRLRYFKTLSARVSSDHTDVKDIFIDSLWLLVCLKSKLKMQQWFQHGSSTYLGTGDSYCSVNLCFLEIDFASHWHQIGHYGYAHEPNARRWLAECMMNQFLLWFLVNWQFYLPQEQQVKQFVWYRFPMAWQAWLAPYTPFPHLTQIPVRDMWSVSRSQNTFYTTEKQKHTTSSGKKTSWESCKALCLHETLTL